MPGTSVSKLDFETLQKIVNFFGGKLFKDDKIDSYYKCNQYDSQFDICIGNDINDEENGEINYVPFGISKLYVMLFYN